MYGNNGTLNKHFLLLTNKSHIFAFIKINVMNKNTKEIYLAGGCFWGTEHYLKMIEGVLFTEVGYANSVIENPSYEDVCSGKTMAAETVYIKYDPSVISLEMLLDMYFVSIDPTSINKQGHDVGLQYRTGIYYTDENDLSVINDVILRQQRNYDEDIVVEVMPLENFYAAEDYHQDYLDKNPNGYCHLPLELFEFARKMSFN